MFLICIPLYFYFVNMNLYVTELGWEFSAAKMSLAQVSDVIFLILLPIMLSRLGYKKTIFIGILAWAARYFLLAGSVDSVSMQTMMVFSAILLHGVCYDFLFIAGQLYVDDEANERMRGAAQGLIPFILWGVGAFVGTQLAGSLQAINTLAQPIGNIFGDTGGIEIEIPFNAPPDKPTRLWLHTSGHTEEIVFDICDQYTIQGDLFSRAILDNTEVSTPLEDALNNMLVIEAVFKSS